MLFKPLNGFLPESWMVVVATVAREAFSIVVFNAEFTRNLSVLFFDQFAAFIDRPL